MLVACATVAQLQAASAGPYSRGHINAGRKPYIPCLSRTKMAFCSRQGSRMMGIGRQCDWVSKSSLGVIGRKYMMPYQHF